jgi:hypothetical protein
MQIHGGEDHRELSLHPCVDPVLRCHHPTHEKRPAGKQHPHRFTQQPTPAVCPAQHLHQQHRIKRPVAERQPPPIGLHEPGAAKPGGESLQHAERQVSRDIVIAGRNERPADASRTRAQIQQARLGRQSGPQHGVPYRFGHTVRQRPPPVEVRRHPIIDVHARCSRDQ